MALGANLTNADYLFCPHRCHGHFIAYGGNPESLIAELMGKVYGRMCWAWGQVNTFITKTFSPAGVQGGIVGNATGAALALKLKKENGIAVAVLGDGYAG